MIKFIRVSLRLITIVFLAYFFWRMHRNWKLKERKTVNLIARIEFCKKSKIPLQWTFLVRNRKMCLIKNVQIDPGLFKDRFYLISYPRYHVIHEKNIEEFY